MIDLVAVLLALAGLSAIAAVLGMRAVSASRLTAATEKSP